MKIKYIELFSGIGAFTQAIENLTYVNAECVFAADINVSCANVYRNNYNVESLCDITLQNEKKIKKHDLCFFSPPCQAFSKSGHQKGFEDTRGTLIYDVFRILQEKKPRFILMENVRNLVSHNDGKTISTINDALRNLGYRIPNMPIILSPHYFGVPQTRERAFLPGIYDPENVDKPLEIKFDRFFTKDECTINDILDHAYDDDLSLRISEHEENVLNIWNEFYQGLDVKVIGFPVWYDYFYDKQLDEKMPQWKKDFIIKNKDLYFRNKKHIDKWAKKHNYLKGLTPTQRKFEWQAGEKIESVWDGIIQFRPSGVRVKRPTESPTLVAMVHVPIIGKYKRYLTIKEAAKLQSFPSGYNFNNESDFNAYKQLGNAVNVEVIYQVFKRRGKNL